VGHRNDAGRGPQNLSGLEGLSDPTGSGPAEGSLTQPTPTAGLRTVQIELRLFASLRKQLPPGSPRGKCALDLADGSTIGDVLVRMNIPRASAQMILVNGDHDRDFDRALHDGDVLSIFPPVAGG
jgi:molybdopterin converting factor small subunit